MKRARLISTSLAKHSQLILDNYLIVAPAVHLANVHAR